MTSAMTTGPAARDTENHAPDSRDHDTRDPDTSDPNTSDHDTLPVVPVQDVPALLSALDLFTRAHMGQLGSVSGFFHWKDREQARSFLSAAGAALSGLPHHGSHGIHSPEISDLARVCWDLLQVIRYEVHHDRPSARYTVLSNPPVRSSTTELALPRATRLGDGSIRLSLTAGQAESLLQAMRLYDTVLRGNLKALLTPACRGLVNPGMAEAGFHIRKARALMDPRPDEEFNALTRCLEMAFRPRPLKPAVFARM